MIPSQPGRMVEAVWLALPSRFPHVRLDAFVVMPDHFHGLIHISSAPSSRLARAPGEPCGPPRGSLGQVVQAFKSNTTRLYALGVHEDGWPPFRRRLWQRDYHDWVIRDDAHLRNTRRYIELNPMRWDRRRGG